MMCCVLLRLLDFWFVMFVSCLFVSFCSFLLRVVVIYIYTCFRVALRFAGLCPPFFFGGGCLVCWFVCVVVRARFLLVGWFLLFLVLCVGVRVCGVFVLAVFVLFVCFVFACARVGCVCACVCDC